MRCSARRAGGLCLSAIAISAYAARALAQPAGPQEGTGDALVRRGNVASCLSQLHEVRLGMRFGGIAGAVATNNQTFNLTAIISDPQRNPYTFCGLVFYTQWQDNIMLSHPFLPVNLTFGEIFSANFANWTKWWGEGTTFSRWVNSALDYSLADGAIYDEFAFFSPQLGFHPQSPRKDYMILILSEPGHRTTGESMAPLLCGCGTL